MTRNSKSNTIIYIFSKTLRPKYFEVFNEGIDQVSQDLNF